MFFILMYFPLYVLFSFRGILQTSNKELENYVMVI